MYAQMVAFAAVMAQSSSTTTSTVDLTQAFWVFVGNFIIGGAVGFFIGNWRGRPLLGFILGGLLGCLGWIITAVLSKKRPY